MDYSKIQKTISLFLLTFFLFGLVFRFPFSGVTEYSEAGDRSLSSIVSIFVNNDMYPEVESEVKRYANDIQQHLENTRAIIVPTPNDATAFEIASMIEKLYYEGYKGVNSSASFQSKLVGSVFVGDVSLPVVFDGGTGVRTVVPYTDFDDKMYVYDHEKQSYQKNTSNLGGLKSEIWHGVISPNTGDRLLNIEAVKSYFSKNHAYYQGEDQFEVERGIHHGNNTESFRVDYKPYVFYFDQFREESGIHYPRFKGYEAYLENKEDIAYNRYSKQLAEKIQNKVLSGEQEEVKDLIASLDSDIDVSSLSSGPDISKSSDIATRFITNNVVKNFLEVINGTTLGEFRENVYNAGRYNGTGSQVRVDTVPYLIGVMDSISDNVVKGANTDIEGFIDDLVINKFSGTIKIPLRYTSAPSGCIHKNENFLHGTQASKITQASQCSIYRGSSEGGGTLVESNRGLNIENIDADIRLCENGGTQARWGGNSPVNLRQDKMGNGTLELGESGGYNLKSSITPLYDPKGSYIAPNGKVSSPLDCLDNSFIAIERQELVEVQRGGDESDWECQTVYRAPVDGADALNFKCENPNVVGGTAPLYGSWESYSVPSCTNVSVYKNNQRMHSFIGQEVWEGGGDDRQRCIFSNIRYDYNEIPSYIMHKAPTSEHLGSQIASLITPNLPIDKDRYVDFIGKRSEEYEKIYYPQLFRTKVNLGDYSTFDEQIQAVGKEVDRILDEHTKKLSSYTPGGATSIVDVKKFLKNKPVQKLSLGNDEKNISYYDMLILSVYWNNLSSVSEKYKFVFENYLSDQFKNSDKTALAKNKKQYEIAYMGAPGDAQNMYIKVDPEGKEVHPYGDIVSENQSLSSSLFSSNVSSTEYDSEGTFSCAPPEGVYIWEWIPAVVCWIKDMLPPKVSLSASKCSAESLFEGEEIVGFYDYGQNDETCHIDENKDGIIDCLAADLQKATINLDVNNQRLYYNQTAQFSAKLLVENGDIIRKAHNLGITFELEKLEIVGEKEEDVTLVYSKEKHTDESFQEVEKYVSFSSTEVPTRYGKSLYALSVKNKDINLYLSAHSHLINSNDEMVAEVVSNIVEVKVRSDRPYAESYIIGENNEVSPGDTIEANSDANVFVVDGDRYTLGESVTLARSASLAQDKNLIILSHKDKSGKNIPLSYPLKVSLSKGGIQSFEDIILQEGAKNIVNNLYALQEAGEYDIEFRDAKDVVIKKKLSVIPAKVSDIEISLGANIIQTGKNITSNIFSLKDDYGNIGLGSIYRLELESIGNTFSLMGNNGEPLSKKSYYTAEGFGAFKLLSSDVEGKNFLRVSLLGEKGNKIFTKEVQIQTLSSIIPSVSYNKNDAIVGGKKVVFSLEMKGADGNILSTMNSRVYASVPEEYGTIEGGYFNVENGIAKIPFVTGKVSGREVPLTLSIAGIHSQIHQHIEIKPGKALKVDLVFDRSRIKADSKDSVKLQTELKDRYGNRVYTDNSTKIGLELNNNSKKILQIGASSKNVTGGITSFELSSTSVPGTAFVKVTTTPSLSENSIVIGDGDGKLSIKGVGENVADVTSYYFWNKDNIEGNNYNALYSVLLGANYGDINQKDYLAGSLLFDSNSQNLSVTTLLNKPQEYGSVVSMGYAGGVKSNKDSSDITQNISSRAQINSDKKLSINLHNKTLDIPVGKVHYAFPKTVRLLPCAGTQMMGECINDTNETTIAISGVSSDYTPLLAGNELSLIDSLGQEIMSIGDDGTFELTGGISLSIGEYTETDYLLLNISDEKGEIGQIGVHMVGHKTLVTRDEGSVLSKVKNLSNGVVLYMPSYFYGTNNIYVSNSKEPIVSIYYNDPFAARGELTKQNQVYGVENFEKDGSIGWEGGNKTLLSFASGKSVGDSVKDYMSIGVINLGDPVLSLRSVKKQFHDAVGAEKSFDSGIGKLIAKDDGLVGYRKIDYDADKKEDVLLIHNNGYLQLLENKQHSAPFLNKGNLAYIPDMGNHEQLVVGDFMGDSYEDIFFVNNKGEPFLLNNRGKDFERVSLKDQMLINGSIVQVGVFDMNNDEVSDIVTLHDTGSISIFYGNDGGNGLPVFEKKKVSDGFGVKLDDSSRSSGGYIYYDGLLQTDNDRYINNIKAQIKKNDPANGLQSSGLDERLIDGIVFSEILYSGGGVDENVTVEEVVGGIGNNVTPELGTSSFETRKELRDILAGGNVGITGRNYGTKKDFLRSEYASVVGLDVAKVFTDRNGGNIQSGDIVDVVVKIKNNSAEIKKGIAYVDKVVSPFKMTNTQIVTTKGVIKRPPSTYDLLVDGFNLASLEEMVISYELKVRPIKFGHIKLGLFEKGEVGDDEYGDIIIRDGKHNCGDDVEIFRSSAAKSYMKGSREPWCNSSSKEVPANITKHMTDANNNGVPDYIDEIVSNQQKQKEYGEEALSDINKDSDNDGVPDREDMDPNYNSNDSSSGFLSALDDFNAWSDDASAKVDTILEGLGCTLGGGGGCLSLPMNWAPLAPGGDPVVFGKPAGDGLKVGEGIPIFSAFTGRQIFTTFGGPMCLPSVYTPFGGNKAALSPGICGPQSAGGKYGTWSPNNFIRLFATPTLTGGFGTIACYGGPAIVAGNSNPPGVSPVIPGGNCIVAAVPLLSCSNDGSDGDPEEIGKADNFGDYGVVNANCSAVGNNNAKLYQKQNPNSISAGFVKDYYAYKDGSLSSTGINTKYPASSMGDVLDGKQLDNPLFSVGDEGIALNLDFSGNTEETFDDEVEIIEQQRVAAFPGPLMEWFTAQSEEFITKFTDFPTVFVNLPDIGGVFESDWEEYITGGVEEAYEQGKSNAVNQEKKAQKNIDILGEQYKDLGCEDSGSIDCYKLQADAFKEKLPNVIPGRQEFSGIQTVFEFIGNIPFVTVKPQKITVNIPMPDSGTIDKASLDWSTSLSSWKQEYQNILKKPGFTTNCSSLIGDRKVLCEEVNLKADNLAKTIIDLERNLQTLEGYHDIPKKLTKLLNQKEVWAAQILCNVEAIGGLSGEWISSNGKRFKAWVETYLVVKSMLKSWQLLIDVFTDYDEECHNCKNERGDLLDFQFSMVSMILPKIPIIQLPKWPDIILDLHDIKLGIILEIPDIDFQYRPLVLPTLPGVKLPEFSLDTSADINANLDLVKSFSLPSMGQLESFDIPDLGDFPGIKSLPAIELPNLPPPPKLPKMFSSLEGMLKIFKLVTKVMCILKTSPFVPEWRAGDQVAFKTERASFLPTDFLNLTLPQISLPFVDAIKVTTHVNFEIETEFLVEMARQIVDPLNTKANNFVDSFGSYDTGSLDLSEYSKSAEINVDASDEGINIDGSLLNFSRDIIASLLSVYIYIDTSKEELIPANEFIAIVIEGLADEAVTSDKRTKELRSIWNTLALHKYEEEEKVIADLAHANKEKFAAVEYILENEIRKTQQLQKDVEAIYSGERKQTPLFSKINAQNTPDDFVEYDSMLDGHNERFKKAAKKLYAGESAEDSSYAQLEEEGERLLSRISGGLGEYKKGERLALNGSSNQKYSAKKSCQTGTGHGYQYEGIYVVEKEKSYRLFDYIDELTGDNTYTSIDFDSDGDNDILYFVNGELFLKENLTTIKDRTYISDAPEVVESDELVYLNGENFIEAINGFREINPDSGYINMSFNSPTRKDVNNFRIELYEIVDNIFNIGNDSYAPEGTKKDVIDAFRLVNKKTIKKQSEQYIKRNHLAYIDYLGNLPEVTLSTRMMVPVDDTKKARILRGKSVYTGNKRATITYQMQKGQDGDNTVILEPNSSLEFRDNVVIKEMTGALYVKGNEEVILKGSAEIADYVGLPLFGESVFIADDAVEYNQSSHIDVNFYDGSRNALNFRDVSSYRIVDLGYESVNHLVRVKVQNDNYYSRIFAFMEDGIVGTVSGQKLSAPQIWADSLAPDMNFFEGFSVPVYQSKTYDLTDSIHENSGISGIEKISVDMNLDIDTDDDGDTQNDNETYNVSLNKANGKIEVTFGPFDYPVSKKIAFSLWDKNNNKGYHEFDFEVYTPLPTVEKIEQKAIIGLLNEPIVGEGVNIYRLRGGQITKLHDSGGGQKVFTKKEGIFSFPSPETGSGLTLTYNDKQVAFINETNGKVLLSDSSVSLFLKEGASGYPEIQILSSTGVPIYTQEFSLPDNREVTIQDDLLDITEAGIFMSLEQNRGYSYYAIPSAANYNPGAVVIYSTGDSSKTPIFIIFPDGRISIKNNAYQMKYSGEGEDVIFQLFNGTTNTKIADVLFSLEASYLMR